MSLMKGSLAFTAPIHMIIINLKSTFFQVRVIDNVHKYFSRRLSHPDSDFHEVSWTQLHVRGNKLHGNVYKGADLIAGSVTTLFLQGII